MSRLPRWLKNWAGWALLLALVLGTFLILFLNAREARRDCEAHGYTWVDQRSWRGGVCTLGLAP